MIYQLSKILEDVRVCLDRNQTDTALISDGDEETLQLDELIQSKVTEGVDAAHLAAPYWKLEQGHNFADRIFWKEKESGYVLLPDNFLRLVVFEMSDWETPVYEAITVDDPRYAQCRSRIKALRGTAQRPVCAIAVETFGRILEFYSCKSEDATVERAVYVPLAKIDGNDGVDISKQCYEAAVYQIAALTLQAMGEAQQAQVLLGNNV